jgi:CO/xanthine dehydrogenase Mo-binding subunit
LVYEEGQLLTTSFANYLLPGAKEVPRIDVLHIETPSPVTETGIKGMGEGGVLAGPAAIANAVADALAPFSASISELPLTPERVAALVNIGTPLPHRREIDSYRGSTEEVSGSNPTTS